MQEQAFLNAPALTVKFQQGRESHIKRHITTTDHYASLMLTVHLLLLAAHVAAPVPTMRLLNFLP